jgi:uncharacterized membrane protein
MKINYVTIVLILALILTPFTGYSESKSYWLPGMGIGMAGGATIGLIAGAAGRCTGTSEPDDCKGMRSLAMLIGATGGLVVGGGIGAAVGACIKKKPKVSLYPTLLGDPSGVSGGGLGMTFAITPQHY